jgi:hypothetical protein
MIWTRSLLLMACLGSAVTITAMADEPNVTPEQLHSELKWVGRDCKKPGVPPPKPIHTVTYEDMARMTTDKRFKPKYVSWRRWIDVDGDGVCEIFDVGMPEVSNEPSGKFYGYPTRMLGFKNGEWSVISRMSLGWLPVVLADRRTGKVYGFAVTNGGNAGDIGGWPAGNWGHITFSDCQQFRKEISLAYMFAFDPPPELRSDELMSKVWTGGEQVFVVFPGVKALTENAKSLSCIKPYLDIAALIDKRVRELYPFYFSGPGGLK